MGMGWDDPTLLPSLKEKKRNINQYLDATASTTASSTPPASAGPVISTGRRYGDRPGEKRIDVSDFTRPLGSNLGRKIGRKQ